MKKAIRLSTFETNSSSAHVFMVFDDEALFDEWKGNPDMFLDLRDAEWVSNHDVDCWESFDTGYVSYVGEDAVIWRDTPAYEEAKDFVCEEEDSYNLVLGIPEDDHFPRERVDDEMLASFHIVSSGALSHYERLAGWLDEDGANFGYGTDAEGHVSDVNGLPLHVIGIFE